MPLKNLVQFIGHVSKLLLPFIKALIHARDQYLLYIQDATRKKISLENQLDRGGNIMVSPEKCISNMAPNFLFIKSLTQSNLRVQLVHAKMSPCHKILFQTAKKKIGQHYTTFFTVKSFQATMIKKHNKGVTKAILIFFVSEIFEPFYPY